MCWVCDIAAGVSSSLTEQEQNHLLERNEGNEVVFLTSQAQIEMNVKDFTVFP